MGCGTSKEDIAKYVALQQERDEIALAKSELEKRLKDLQELFDENELKCQEQLNLYRFKIEVLVQMLAVEEKKLQSAVKRLEALKLAMLNQGFSDKTMSNVLLSGGESPTKKEGEKAILLTSAFDLTGAIDRLSTEMKKSAEDIIFAFADSDGKIVSALPREDFMRYLYNSTDTLTKTDVQVLSLRFYDGSTVSVPEFIDFFTCSSSTRVAKSAAAAVRASLNMLQLEAPKDNLEECSETLASGQQESMSVLQRSISKLRSLWDIVEEELISEFDDIDENIGGDSMVLIETFEEVLDIVCGPSKEEELRRFGVAAQDRRKWLTAPEVKQIVSRFEIGRRVDIKDFMTYFQQATVDDSLTTVAPFRFSSEWATLRSVSRKELSTVNAFKSGIAHPSESSKPRGVEAFKRATKKISAVNAMKGGSAQEKAKQLMVNTDIKDFDLEASRSTATPPPLAKIQSASALQTDSLNPPTLLHSKSASSLAPSSPGKLTSSPSKRFLKKEKSISAATLAMVYSRDPESFAAELEKRSEASAYLFTDVLLKKHLMEMCPAAKEKNVDEFVAGMEYPGGTCSAAAVVEALNALVEGIFAEHYPNHTQSKAHEVIHTAQTEVQRREENIRTLKQQVLLDPIALFYKNDPKGFVAGVKLETQGGKGNAVSKDGLVKAIRNIVPGVNDSDIDLLLTELEGKVRVQTNDILVTSVTTHLKQRATEKAKIEKQIAIEEKALKSAQDRAVRMEERAKKIEEYHDKAKLDPISSTYKLEPKSFQADLASHSVDKKGKSIHVDTYASAIKAIVKDSSEVDIDKLKSDVRSKIDSKTSTIPLSAITSVLKTRVTYALKNYNLAKKEEAAQEKDRAIASGEKPAGGGCCGGSTSGVHDPSKAPSDIPTVPGVPNTEQTEANKENAVCTFNDSDPESSFKSPSEKATPAMGTGGYKRGETVDTLTFSDAGSVHEYKSDDDKSHDILLGGPSRTGFQRPKKTNRITRSKRVPASRQQRLSDDESSRDMFGDESMDDKESYRGRNAGAYSSDNSDEEVFTSLRK